MTFPAVDLAVIRAVPVVPPVGIDHVDAVATEDLGEPPDDLGGAADVSGVALYLVGDAGAWQILQDVFEP